MNLIEKIMSSQTVWLSTHKNADGDGLGSEVAFYYALKSIGKKVQLIHNDITPKRYHFLTKEIEVFSATDTSKLQIQAKDLVIIFDTHDPLLCSPLFNFLQDKSVPVVFLDHHVPVWNALANVEYVIDESACCTGEMVYELIKKMNIPITEKMATPLYASLIFDTQNFKFIRGSSRPFKMAAELLDCGANQLQIQKNIFDNWTIRKMNCLSQLIQTADYKDQQRLAIIKIDLKTLVEHELESDDVSDFVDLFMSIQSLDVAIVIREEDVNYYKLSFRSRSHEVLTWAQSFSGGGHLYSSGAWVRDSQANIIHRLDQLIANNELKTASSQ